MAPGDYDKGFTLVAHSVSSREHYGGICSFGYITETFSGWRDALE